MISADRLLPLWLKYRDALEAPIQTFEFAKFNRRFEDRTYQMGVLNLSSDSSYRETVCHTFEAALYRGRRMTLEGAAMVDIGAESTGETADVVSTQKQIDRMRPVVRALADENILVSVETYHPEVGIALLEAGAGVINLTGRVDDQELYRAIAKHQAGVVLCYTPGENARSVDHLPPADEIFDQQLTFFKKRINLATEAGVERLWVDPGFAIRPTAFCSLSVCGSLAGRSRFNCPAPCIYSAMKCALHKQVPRRSRFSPRRIWSAATRCRACNRFLICRILPDRNTVTRQHVR